MLLQQADGSGATPISTAVDCGNMEAVEMLLSKGAKCDTRAVTHKPSVTVSTLTYVYSLIMLFTRRRITIS